MSKQEHTQSCIGLQSQGASARVKKGMPAHSTRSLPRKVVDLPSDCVQAHTRTRTRTTHTHLDTCAHTPLHLQTHRRECIQELHRYDTHRQHRRADKLCRKGSQAPAPAPAQNRNKSKPRAYLSAVEISAHLHRPLLPIGAVWFRVNRRCQPQRQQSPTQGNQTPSGMSGEEPKPKQARL